MAQSIPKQYLAVRRVMNELRAGRPLRQLITLQSENRLKQMAINHPNETRDLLKGMLTLKQLAQTPAKIIIPEEIESLMTRGRWIAPLFEALDNERRLDLRRIEDHSSEERDLSAERFKDLNYFNKLRETFNGANLEIISKDPELADITLYFSILHSRIFLYQAQEEWAAVAKSGNETEICDCRASILIARAFLKHIIEVFPFGTISNRLNYKEAVEMVIALIGRGNVPAAHAKLVSLCERIEQDCERQEKSRIRQERRSSYKRPKPGEDLMNLARRIYQIRFSPDGIWIIPQTGYKSAAGVKKRTTISHQVPEGDVLRRTDHQLERITKEMAINAHFSAMLKGLAPTFRSGGENLKTAINSLAEAYLAYEKSLALPKVKTRLIVSLVIELTKTADKITDAQARKRILGFSAGMLNKAGRELDLRNQNLAIQLRRISAKQKIQQAVLEQILAMDVEVRSACDIILKGLKTRKVVWSPKELGRLREVAVSARKAIEEREFDFGYSRIGNYLTALVNQIAKLRRLITEKKTLSDKLLRIRDDYKQIGRENALQNAVELIAEISKDNTEIKNTLLEALKLVFKADDSLKNKSLKEDPDKEDLSEYFRLAQGINTKAADLVMAVDRSEHPRALGEILRSDAAELGLRYFEISEWEKLKSN